MIFALIFALMAGFVAVVTVSALKARYDVPVPTPEGLSSAPLSAGSANQTAAQARLNAALAAALRPEVLTHQGTLAVGVIDLATGSMAVYDASLRVPAGGIVQANIVATLLLQRQQSGTPVPAHDASLATEMIEGGSRVAAGALWRLVGVAAGVDAANRVLKLTHTRLGKDGRWGLTSTTVADQLQLLTDLTSANSPLDAASRAYAVSLMEHMAPGQEWGIPAAASPATRYAVESAWLAGPRVHVLDSIGVVRRNGAELLIVVLSKDNPAKAAGIARAEAAAVAAAEVIAAGSS